MKFVLFAVFYTITGCLASPPRLEPGSPTLRSAVLCGVIVPQEEGREGDYGHPKEAAAVQPWSSGAKDFDSWRLRLGSLPLLLTVTSRSAGTRVWVSSRSP